MLAARVSITCQIRKSLNALSGRRMGQPVAAHRIVVTGGSSGIGLVLCRQLVADHSGQTRTPMPRVPLAERQSCHATCQDERFVVQNRFVKREEASEPSPPTRQIHEATLDRRRLAGAYARPPCADHSARARTPRGSLRPLSLRTASCDSAACAASDTRARPGVRAVRS